MRRRHDCPTPDIGLSIGEYWKCSCGRWWAVVDVDGSNRGAWLMVGRTHLTSRQEITDALRRQSDLTIITREDIALAQTRGDQP